MKKTMQRLFFKQLVIIIVFSLLSNVGMSLLSQGYELTVYTDKAQYYPGEEVLVYGWLTDDEIGMPNQGVCVEVIDPEQVVISAGCFLTNDEGYYEFPVQLEVTAIPGVYNVTAVAHLEYDVYGYTEFEVLSDNLPPEAPLIDGPTEGIAGEDYDYTFVSNDPDTDDVYYWIQWGDGCPAVEWIGPFPSGVEATVNHTFTEQGTFTISAKARDGDWAESGWGFLDVEMPVDTTINNHPLWMLLQQIIERFPLLKLLLFLF
jgi:hypothetical protein